jgi:hypothetical protein
LDASTAVLAFSRTAILLKLRAAVLNLKDGSSWETLQGSQAHAATMRTQVFVNVEDGGFRQSGWRESIGTLTATSRSNDCRGMIRVYSELLVEENKRRRRQNWNPGALFGLPGWWW